MKIVVKPFNKARLKLKLEGDIEFYELVQKCEEYFPERLSQYFMSGLPKDSDEYRDLEASFRSVSLGTNCLVPHPLRPGYFLGGVGKVSSPISHSKMVE